MTLLGRSPRGLQTKEKKSETVIYAEEIEEAIMQYLVKQFGHDYDKLCNNQFKLYNQAYDVDSKELILTVSDLKCARIEVI